MHIIESYKNLNKKELVILFSSLFLIIASFILFKNKNYLTLIASLIGANALIFVDKGDVLGQILTIIFSLFYGYISYEYKYYGELITYLGMSAPIAFISAIIWIKNPYSKLEVKTSDLNIKKGIILFISAIIITITFYFILKYLNTTNLLISSISVFTSFLAVSLMMLRSKYYALAYAMNDIILIIMWILASFDNISYVPMVVCFVIFLVNDTYGFINWNILEKKQKENKNEKSIND